MKIMDMKKSIFHIQIMQCLFFHKFVAQYTEFFKVRIIKKNQEQSSNYLIKFMKKVMRGSIMNSVLKGS